MVQYGKHRRRIYVLSADIFGGRLWKRRSSGSRGWAAAAIRSIKDLLIDMPHVEIAAVCDDLCRTARKRAQALVYERDRQSGPSPTKGVFGAAGAAATSRPCSSSRPWETHIPFAIEAMRAKVPVAVEVGGASNLQRVLGSGARVGGDKDALHVPRKLLLRKDRADGDEHGPPGRVRRARPLRGRVCARSARRRSPEGDINHHYRLRHYKPAQLRELPHARAGPDREASGHQLRQPHAHAVL